MNFRREVVLVHIEVTIFLESMRILIPVSFTMSTCCLIFDEQKSLFQIYPLLYLVRLKEYACQLDQSSCVMVVTIASWEGGQPKEFP